MQKYDLSRMDAEGSVAVIDAMTYHAALESKYGDFAGYQTDLCCKA